ncbi:MAG TPA: tripartite tricarboxylate transporter substrate-binding protein [Candidatus Binatia bacterium]|nr:tripartite tricarboxylate transporter substrate-binding protein [Candidatus Binatia bacterium]
MKRMIVAIFLFLLIGNPGAHAQTPFYQGKTITFITGSNPGELFDLYVRTISQHMVKHIPGNPDAIVQNMPGAGHMIAANHVYNIAKPDGLTLAGTLATLYIDQLVGQPEVKYDWAKFTWIGNAGKSPQMMYMRADTPYQTIEDVRKAKEPPKCGSTGISNSAYVVPKLLEETIGAKFDVVLGYKGGSAIDLAVERGEVVCRAFSTEAYFSREPFHTWRKKGFVRVLVQGGKTRDEKLPDTPTFDEVMEKYNVPESGRRLVTVMLAAGEFFRPHYGPPGIPPERVKILREAYMKTMQDPAFLAEAKKQKLEINPTSGEEMDALIKELMSQPPETIARMKKLLKK